MLSIHDGERHIAPEIQPSRITAALRIGSSMNGLLKMDSTVLVNRSRETFCPVEIDLLNLNLDTVRISQTDAAAGLGGIADMLSRNPNGPKGLPQVEQGRAAALF
jgi:hypothetical protein